MISKEKFIKDVESVLHDMDCAETNKLISYDSYWILSAIIEKVIVDADKYMAAISLKHLADEL